MDDSEPIQDNHLGRIPQPQSKPAFSFLPRINQLDSSPHHSLETISFDRHELREILNLYGKKVAEGEWRDYTIDFTPQKAVFSVYRKASEYPLYRIEKNSKLARKQGAFSVITTTGLILKRGPELRKVLEVLDKKLKLVPGPMAK
jgi:hypothetical protein